MDIVKVLKRKDASSVILAVVIAMILNSLVMTMSMQLSMKISGTDQSGRAIDLKLTFLQPIVSALIQLIFLEIIVKVYVFIHQSMTTSKK